MLIKLLVMRIFLLATCTTTILSSDTTEQRLLDMLCIDRICIIFYGTHTALNKSLFKPVHKMPCMTQ